VVHENQKQDPAKLPAWLSGAVMLGGEVTFPRAVLMLARYSAPVRSILDFGTAFSVCPLTTTRGAGAGRQARPPLSSLVRGTEPATTRCVGLSVTAPASQCALWQVPARRLTCCGSVRFDIASPAF
jgi:hypothetical protein